MNPNGECEKLRMALNMAQDQQNKLEKTLSSETKVKMDLFSALGAAKRQLQISESKFILFWKENMNQKVPKLIKIQYLMHCWFLNNVNIQFFKASPLYK